MPKKQKINNCLDCKESAMNPNFDCMLLCCEKGKNIGTPLQVKCKNIIPDWCPLEDW
jgi:hypothetical protein